ncbi:hypothetical protein [Mycobacterium lehmannii]|uniref:hypothetical protein n=1 Tax=Mycobacterium lehmannii TaxID=2048550 RepID=UPI001E342473|nr:hypothetical protein [Mycobacterium lehmannii]
MAGGTQSQITRVLGEFAEFMTIDVSGFQMSRDHLVGFERDAGSARRHPIGQACMQFRSVRLQQSPVGDIADQHMMESPYSFVPDVGARGLGEFQTAKSVERHLDRIRLTTGERAHCTDREVAPHHRGDLQYAPVGRVETFQSRREQGVNRRWDGDGVDVDRQFPAGRLLDENPVVGKHSDEFPHEQGVAAGGGRQPMK